MFCDFSAILPFLGAELRREPLVPSNGNVTGEVKWPDPHSKTLQLAPGVKPTRKKRKLSESGANREECSTDLLDMEQIFADTEEERRPWDDRMATLFGASEAPKSNGPKVAPPKRPDRRAVLSLTEQVGLHPSSTEPGSGREFEGRVDRFPAVPQDSASPASSLDSQQFQQVLLELCQQKDQQKAQALLLLQRQLEQQARSQYQPPLPDWTTGAIPSPPEAVALKFIQELHNLSQLQRSAMWPLSMPMTAPMMPITPSTMPVSMPMPITASTRGWSLPAGSVFGQMGRPPTFHRSASMELLAAKNDSPPAGPGSRRLPPKGKSPLLGRSGKSAFKPVEPVESKKRKA